MNMTMIPSAYYSEIDGVLYLHPTLYDALG